MYKRIKKLVPKRLLFWLRKARFYINSLIFLPRYVYWDGVKINTRGWATANVELWKRTRNVKIYEPETTALWKKMVRSPENGVFWDLGSHVGYYSLIAAKGGKEVYAFDIDDNMVREAEKHMKFNNLDFRVFNFPLGVEGKEASFECFTGKFVKPESSADGFIKGHPRPDVIKVDIEGGETDFIEGAKNLLLSGKIKLIIELLPEWRDGIVGGMEKLGYRLVKELDYSEGSCNGLFLND